MSRFLLAALALTILLAAGGCTKRVPVESGKFDAMGKYQVTFADGSSVRGKMNLNEAVEVTAGGNIYRGTIADLSPDEILVENCRLIRKVDSEESEQTRMYEAVRNLEQEPAQFVFKLSDVKQVDRVKVDPLQTATRSAFWALTGIVSAILLSEKS
ncbi:MAG: hypothetical protein KBD56_03030 [Candidatus Eisenbacteria bacterium]|nr:hypothetical protein [Candidatus Eisenbacteria bacterium]